MWRPSPPTGVQAVALTKKGTEGACPPSRPFPLLLFVLRTVQLLSRFHFQGLLQAVRSPRPRRDVASSLQRSSPLRQRARGKLPSCSGTIGHQATLTPLSFCLEGYRNSLSGHGKEHRGFRHSVEHFIQISSVPTRNGELCWLR